MKTLQHLLSPIKIRSLELSNRLVMPAMGTALGNPDSTVSEANLAYMKRRAQSGAVAPAERRSRRHRGAHPCGW